MQIIINILQLELVLLSEPIFGAGDYTGNYN